MDYNTLDLITTLTLLCIRNQTDSMEPPPLAVVVLAVSKRVRCNQDVISAISDLLDSSLRWTLSQAAVKGSRFLMERLSYRHPFDRLDPHFRQWIYTKAMTRAAANGDLDFVQWLTARFPGCFVTLAVEEAACTGQLAILQWLYVHHDNVRWGCGELEHALRNNHVKVAQWLHQTMPQFAQEDMKHAAVESGNLELLEWSYRIWPERVNLIGPALQSGSVAVLEWVVRNRLFISTSRLYLVPNVASRLGNLDVIKWMIERDMGHFTWDTLHLACSNGHFELVKLIVEWIVEHRLMRQQSDATIDAICSKGNLEIVQWLSVKIPDCFTEAAMNFAALHGHLDIVVYLHENRTEGCTQLAMDFAAGKGFLNIVQFLHKHRTEGCSTNAMDEAATNGHLHVVKWLHTHRNEGCTDLAIEMAARNGHLDVVQWLHENRSEGCTPYAMAEAACGGHLDVLKWLRKHCNLSCPDGQAHTALDLAIGYGHFDVVRWLLATQSIGFTKSAYGIAASHGQFEAMLLLRTEFNIQPPGYAFAHAIMNNELEMLQWLLHHFPNNVRDHTLQRPPYPTGPHISSWLREIGYPG